MNTKNRVYELRKELAFWQKVYEHDAPSEMEFRLESKIRELENPDEFGRPRYNGVVSGEDDSGPSFSTPACPACRYCGKKNLAWSRVDGKWRLVDKNGLHTCQEYRKKKGLT